MYSPVNSNAVYQQHVNISKQRRCRSMNVNTATDSLGVYEIQSDIERRVSRTHRLPFS